jgi:MATE family multidrug resistance protein
VAEAILTPREAAPETPPARGGPPRLRGGIREVGLLAWPVVLQMSAETLLQVINSAMVGRLGATELGAVGFGGIWVWSLLCAFFGCATGVQVFTARADGEGRSQECGAWIWHALWVLVPAILLWTALMALGFRTLVAWIGPSAEMQAQTTLYAYARFPGVPIVIVGGVLTSFLRGLGDTRRPMLATFAALIVNVFFAYGLIFGRLGLPAWGVFGAGVAIVISEVVYTAILFAFVLSKRMRLGYATRARRLDLGATRRFLRTSAPIGGQWLLDMMSFAIFTSIVARMGDVEMAASQAMLQLLSLSFMQAVAISIASGTLVGRYIGADDLAAAARSYASAMKLGVGLATVVAILFLSIPDLLMRIFTTDARVLELAGPLLLLGALFQFVDAVGIIAGGSLRGGGDTRWPFAVQATYISVLSTAFVLRFRAGRWRTMLI